MHADEILSVVDKQKTPWGVSGITGRNIQIELYSTVEEIGYDFLMPHPHCGRIFVGHKAKFTE
jgi:hypothetical protein